ncbi:MAG: metal ABC transporter substrate-binding protein, partial [Anaerolineales bacterium]|nr:metal ABC transporter substrate-binding protein [Anaerolineales bacterium]
MRKICARSINLARPVLVIFCLLIILVGCERKDKNSSPQDKIQVATTINIIGDWVKVVGGDKVNVDSLVSTNGDPHTFEPGAREVTKLADAKAIFAIGLGLEAGWLNKLIENASKDSSSIVHLAEFVDPIHWKGHGEEAEHSEHENEVEHKHGEGDPHFWMDPIRVQKAVSEIRDVLVLLDPENSAYYSNNANSYNSTLQSMDKWAIAELSKVPQSKRYLVTGHENLGYFAKRYQFEVIGSLVPALSTEREPTPKEMTEL